MAESDYKALLIDENYLESLENIGIVLKTSAPRQQTSIESRGSL